MRGVFLEEGDVSGVIEEYTLFKFVNHAHTSVYGRSTGQDGKELRTMMVPIIPPTKRGMKARPSSPLLNP